MCAPNTARNYLLTVRLLSIRSFLISEGTHIELPIATLIFARVEVFINWVAQWFASLPAFTKSVRAWMSCNEDHRLRAQFERDRQRLGPNVRKRNAMPSAPVPNLSFNRTV
mmetsp:Transcript_75468/g.174962  ORF Transcript_75468/g.174962 Transcript_75468/m.174962 type:complete len:111 (+) Transcript_75468:91-423(+)